MTNAQWFDKVFLKYLRKAKPEKGSLTDYFYQMFRLKERSIDTFICVADHELRGAVWVDAKPIPGLIDRRVLTMRKDQHAWIRYDEGETFITLENSRGCVNIPKSEWHRTYKKFYVEGNSNA